MVPAKKLIFSLQRELQGEKEEWQAKNNWSALTLTLSIF